MPQNIKPRIALFSNTFGLRDAMGKHVHLIKKVFPLTEIFLERSSGDPKIPAQTYYFVKRYPWMSLYMLEWKIGASLKIFEVCNRPLNRLAFQFEARKFLDYDIVWLQWGLYHSAIHLFPYLASLRERPRLIFDYHGVTPPQYIKSQGKKLIAQKTIQNTCRGADHADICLVRSRYMAEELRRYAKPQKISFNPLPFVGPDLGSCQENLKERYQLAEKKVLLYVGRISAHKNLKVVLQALAKLSQEKVYLVVVGNDRHRSLAQEKMRLVAVARRLRIPHRVIFTGEITEAELVCWYKAADVFVMPSLHEGFCWPLVDAMTYGLPIIASSKGAIPETVGKAALLFAAQDAQGLQEKINLILFDQEKRAELIAHGKIKAQEYTWERYQRVLKDVINF